jgi:hypothetical protein
MPIVKIGDYLETMVTLYPTTPDRAEKNIVLEGTVMTQPLATSVAAKTMMKKDSSPLLTIYKDTKRGDILKVKSVDGNKIVCENLSVKQEWNKPAIIDKYDIMRGDFKLVQRISAGLLESLELIDSIQK